MHPKNEYVLRKVAAMLGSHDQMQLQIQFCKHKLTSNCNILRFRDHLSHSLNVSLMQNKENMYRLNFCMVAEYFSDKRRLRKHYLPGRAVKTQGIERGPSPGSDK